MEYRIIPKTFPSPVKQDEVREALKCLLKGLPPGPLTTELLHALNPTEGGTWTPWFTHAAESVEGDFFDGESLQVTLVYPTTWPVLFLGGSRGVGHLGLTGTRIDLTYTDADGKTGTTVWEVMTPAGKTVLVEGLLQDVAYPVVFKGFFKK